jgi:hypothetical protein
MTARRNHVHRDRNAPIDHPDLDPHLLKGIDRAKGPPASRRPLRRARIPSGRAGWARYARPEPVRHPFEVPSCRPTAGPCRFARRWRRS